MYIICRHRHTSMLTLWNYERVCRSRLVCDHRDIVVMLCLKLKLIFEYGSTLGATVQLLNGQAQKAEVGPCLVRK